jgi:hypothetical protein
MFLNSNNNNTGAVSGVNVPWECFAEQGIQGEWATGRIEHCSMAGITADESMAHYADITKDHRSILIPELARWGDQHGTQRTIQLVGSQL